VIECYIRATGIDASIAESEASTNCGTLFRHVNKGGSHVFHTPGLLEGLVQFIAVAISRIGGMSFACNQQDDINDHVLKKANLPKGRDAKLPVYGLDLGRRGCQRTGCFLHLVNCLRQFVPWQIRSGKSATSVANSALY
jgi:hypothetical protein